MELKDIFRRPKCVCPVDEGYFIVDIWDGGNEYKFNTPCDAVFVDGEDDVQLVEVEVSYDDDEDDEVTQIEVLYKREGRFCKETLTKDGSTFEYC